MISLHVAITHAPWSGLRREWLAEHLRLLDHPATVCADGAEGDRLTTYRCGWDEANHTDASHLVVLADDMRPCPGFIGHLTAALRVRPRSVICLFTMRRVLGQAREHGYSWIETENCAFGGAMVMPCDLWREFAIWEREHVKDDAAHQSDDTRMALWVRATGRRIYLTAPSLVQHIAPSDSLIGHNNPHRVSSWVAGEGETIEWDTASLAGGRCNRGDPRWLKEKA